MRAKEFFDRLCPLLFGYDFFISYRRSDAAAYAESLTASLQASGFVCFLDRDQTVGGVDLAPAIRRSLKRSRSMIVILTPGVVDSSWVKQEVEAFLDRRDRLVPINVAGFLNREGFGDSLFSRLRSRSWIDERATAVIGAEPSAATISGIRAGYNRRRVRVLAGILGVTLLAALLAGSAYVGMGYGEDRRQREIVYVDVRSELAVTKTLLRYMVFAAQDFRSEAVQIGSRPYPPFSRFAEPDVVELFEKFDLARRKQPNAVYGGYQPILQPGDRTVAVVTITKGAQRIAQTMARLRRERLTIGSSSIIRAVDRVANHPAIAALATANDKMSRYHRIDDDNKLRFVVIGSPGVMTRAQYIDFVSALTDLATLLQ